MNKILLINGSPRKKHTCAALEEFAGYLGKYDDIHYEILNLYEYHLDLCRGCIICFDKGEEFCPHHDDLPRILSEIEIADGIIFASPVYAFHVSALLKNLLDRMSFTIHRPRYFGKISMSIVTQGIYGGKTIVKYLSFVAKTMGFSPSGGLVLQTLEPSTKKQMAKNSFKLQKSADLFYHKLKKNYLLPPSLFDLMMFRITRTKIKSVLNEQYRDFIYFKEKGWFESEFYYLVKLGVFKKLLGSIVDILTLILSKPVKS